LKGDKVIRQFKFFLTDLRAAVTTDWMVLSFAMIVIAGFVIAMAEDGSISLADSTVGAMNVERAEMETSAQAPSPP
jgi:hypothetical protein